MLKGKSVVIGVSGGIAAYKVVEVASRLRKLNAEVFVVMTDNATEFVSPLTFQTISHNPVATGMFDEPGNWEIEHITLAKKADLILIAPATANIIGKIANGIADDILTTTVMATKAPVLFVPAMNTAMYENPIVQSNISKLKELGYLFTDAEVGLLACGTIGKGRLPDPSFIVENIIDLLYSPKDMQGINVLITAGPTKEDIDPVRFISNHSSGKMGYAIAEAAKLRGAKVELVSGQVNIDIPFNVNRISVNTAEEMHKEVMQQYEKNDVIILVAAVADYKSDKISDKKIKKTDENMNIILKRNPDIAKELGKVKGKRILVGTCAETNDLLENAKSKLESKNFDMIVANDVTMEGAGFGVDTNIVKIIKRGGAVIEFPLMSKKELAYKILDEVMKMYQGNK